MPDDLHPGTRLRLRPTALAVGGDAVARDDHGQVVFVAGALPGEDVDAEVTDVHARYAHALAGEVIEASPDRQVPPCPHRRAGCGGCDLQHVAPAAQPGLKVELVRDALARLGRIAEPPVRAGEPLPTEGFRTTVRAGVEDSRAGLRRARSHELIAVDHCLVAHPLVDELLVEGRFGAASEVTLRAGPATGERLALLHPTADGARLPDDVVVVGTDELRGGRRAWYHDDIAGHRFRISATSFFQSRADGAAALVAEVTRAVEGNLGPGATVVDAYGGVGLFAASLASPKAVPAEEAVRAVLVERGASSVADARVNLAGHHAKVVRADVDRWRPPAADVVVADPARAGLGRRGAAAVTRAGAPVVVLVSCDPASLGRDAALLAGAGYRLDQAVVVDLFPHTHHIEVVSTFRLG